MPSNGSEDKLTYLLRLDVELQGKNPSVISARAVLAEAKRNGFDPKELYELAVRGRPRAWGPAPRWELVDPSAPAQNEMSFVSRLVPLMQQPKPSLTLVNIVLSEARAMGLDAKAIYRDALAHRPAGLPELPKPDELFHDSPIRT
jgi:uncharacterized protein (UPF0335 family)